MSRRPTDPNRRTVEPADLRTFAADRLRIAADSLKLHRDGVLRGDATAIHRARTTLRRMRSELRVRHLFDAERTHHLRSEARDIGHLLGTVRDRDVIGARLEARRDGLTALEREGVDAVLDRLHRERAGAVRELQRPRTVARYDALVRALEDASTEPPLRAGTDPRAPAAPLVRRSVRRSLGKNRAAAANLRRASTTDTVHELRRAVKHTRYTAEALHDLTGRKEHLRLVRDLQAVQDELGARIDGAAERRWTTETVQASEDARLGYGLAAVAPRDDAPRAARRKAVLRRLDLRRVRR